MWTEDERSDAFSDEAVASRWYIEWTWTDADLRNTSDYSLQEVKYSQYWQNFRLVSEIESKVSPPLHRVSNQLQLLGKIAGVDQEQWTPGQENLEASQGERNSE
jgi:hypothetical protein